MTYRFETIKTNKHILRDYLGIINEIIYTIDLRIQTITIEQEKQELNNKINNLNIYKNLIKQYINNYITRIISDKEFYEIKSLAVLYFEDDIIDCYPSIFQTINYDTLKLSLKVISDELLATNIITDEIHDLLLIILIIQITIIHG